MSGMDDNVIARILHSLRSGEKIEDGLKAMISFCAEDKSHAIDLIRNNALQWIGDFLAAQIPRLADSNTDVEAISLSIRVLSSACQYEQFVSQSVIVLENFDDDLLDGDRTQFTVIIGGKIVWEGICILIGHPQPALAEAATALAIRILKFLPLQHPHLKWDPSSLTSKNKKNNAEKQKNGKFELAEARVEQLDDDPSANNSTAPVASQSSKSSGETSDLEPEPFLRARAAKRFIAGTIKHLQKGIKCPTEVLSLATDSLALFVSESIDYTFSEKPIDTRAESLEDRKKRMRNVRLCRRRARLHANWAFEIGALRSLLPCLDLLASNDRQKASTSFARVCNALDDDDKIKDQVKPFLVGADDDVAPRETYSADFRPPPLDKCRLRAAIESALFLSRPEVGAWALGLSGGVAQLLLLVSSADARCQEVAAEVLCVCAATDSGAPLLAPAVSSGALRSLLQSSIPTTRAAAASALTKLSLKAKALSEDSPELTQTLNVVLDVIRAAANSFSLPEAHSSKSTKSGLVSFTKVNLDSVTSSIKSAGNEEASKVLALTSTERAIEVLAALVGKTHVKEEIVHGSYRVAAAMSPLISLASTPDSYSGSASYGLAHIFAAVTVTNYELRAIALAEKDMSMEQFKQLQELHRVKGKDDEGNDISEEKEADDPDTDELCRIRIKRLVALNVVPALVKIMTQSSVQAKGEAVKALRQISVEPSVRGAVVQQGGLKAACTMCNDDSFETSVRREAAHAVAKTLVTTNPTALSEHLRLGCVRPLVFLCKDVEGTFLQQFEACLALTNLTSFGKTDQDRLASEKGVTAVHFLMFSDHLSVRRAATEVLCNMPTHTSVLKLLRVPETVRLWVVLSDDWDNTDNDDALPTARAALGTLAMAVEDEGVANALIQEKIVEPITRLLTCDSQELIHRTLVLMSGLSESSDTSRLHLLEGGVVPLLSQLLDSDLDLNLKELVKNVAIALSKYSR